MSCRCAVGTREAAVDGMTGRRGLIDVDQARTLRDLARDGDETTFKELARCLGVPTEDLHGLWCRARRDLEHMTRIIQAAGRLDAPSPEGDGHAQQ